MNLPFLRAYFVQNCNVLKSLEYLILCEGAKICVLMSNHRVIYPLPLPFSGRNAVHSFRLSASGQRCYRCVALNGRICTSLRRHVRSAANAASRVDQRFLSAGSGRCMPRCWVRGIVYSRVVSTSVSISACSERVVAELCHLVLTFL